MKIKYLAMLIATFALNMKADKFADLAAVAAKGPGLYDALVNKVPKLGESTKTTFDSFLAKREPVKISAKKLAEAQNLKEQVEILPEYLKTFAQLIQVIAAYLKDLDESIIAPTGEFAEAIPGLGSKLIFSDGTKFSTKAGALLRSLDKYNKPLVEISDQLPNLIKVPEGAEAAGKVQLSKTLTEL